MGLREMGFLFLIDLVVLVLLGLLSYTPKPSLAPLGSLGEVGVSGLCSWLLAWTVWLERVVFDTVTISQQLMLVVRDVMELIEMDTLLYLIIPEHERPR